MKSQNLWCAENRKEIERNRDRDTDVLEKICIERNRDRNVLIKEKKVY